MHDEQGEPDVNQAAIAALTSVGNGGQEEVDLGLNPPLAETLGNTLAVLLAQCDATLVLSWAGENDILLAHMVARRLGIPRASIELDLGLLTVGHPVSGGTRAVLVGVAASSAPSAQVVATLLSEHGSQLVATGYIKQSPADARIHDAGISTVVLER
jgi:hypothetical protein